MKIYAIIPIKHHSSRVPGKNFKLMNGKPLYYWILNTLLSCDKIDKIFIDTDSEELLGNCCVKSDKIILYKRPEKLRGDDMSVNKLLRNIIEDLKLDADLYLQTHTTNPLLTKETIEGAINKFEKNKENNDTLFTVKTLHTRLYDKNGNDLNHNRFHLIPTQQLDPIYEENSCLYLFTKKSLVENDARISKNALLYPMSTIESQDIDWPDDFELTEILMKMKK
jgi:CMP-N-acetylneuraminic acid synthetase